MSSRLSAALLSLAPVTVAAISLTAAPAAAQTSAPAPTAAPAAATAPVKHKPNNYGSPLETIMSSHLWTNVPEARDFVRESRPAAKDLDYTSLTGKDPDRPKPRDAANVMALQAELEEEGAHNAERARGLQAPAKPRRAHKHATSDQ